MTRKGAKGAKGFRGFRGFSLAWRKAVIQNTDAQIDALVYEVYGLTEEEIGVVEGLHR